MSAFYVGQRVRVRYCQRPDKQHLVGKEGVIVEKCVRQWVGYGLDIEPITFEVGYGVSCFSSDQLEPIVPPGLESLEEINALFEPSPVEVRA